MAEQPKRIGIIVPANNTTMEPEIAQLAPFPVTLTVARVVRGPGLLTRADLPGYKANARATAKTLLEVRPDAVFYGCTAAGFLGGPVLDAAFTTELAALFGVPVLSTARAMVEILKREGARSVDVISPYSVEVNDALRAFMADAGITVARVASLLAANVDALGRLTADDVYAVAAQRPTTGAQAVFIACSQLPTAGILPQLRKELGIPVWSSISATAELGFAQVTVAGREIP
jgi:maleate cis-trans isomerase